MPRSALASVGECPAHDHSSRGGCALLPDHVGRGRLRPPQKWVTLRSVPRIR